MSKKSEELRREIANKQAELNYLENEEARNVRIEAIKGLDEFTPLEKIEIFDKLYASAMVNLNDAEDEGTGKDNTDSEHYSWEAHMEILVRKKQLFWDYWNSLPE